MEGDSDRIDTSWIAFAVGSSYTSKRVIELSPRRGSKGRHTDPDTLPVEPVEVKSF